MAIAKVAKFKTRFTASERCPSERGEGQAQQHFAEYCDINRIMAKFEKTGFLDHTAKIPPEFAEYVLPQTLQEAMNVTVKANTMFEELPPEVRNKFLNDPVLLMDFVTNPENESEAIELGLLPPEPSGTAKSEEEVDVGGPDPATATEPTEVTKDPQP